MIPLSMVNGYDLTLRSLSTAALGDLRALLAEVEGLPAEQMQRVLFAAFPELFNPYATAASEVSASFYEEVRTAAGVSGLYMAATLPSVDPLRWGSLVGAGTAPRMLEQGASALMFQFLSGGLTRILTTIAADTIYSNAQSDPAGPRFQRVPAPGCCGFCGMLASRGAAYDSEESALRVVGRGVPVGEGRGHGSKGRGRGIKTRGTRAIGETFHDHCKCRAVQVYPGNKVQMQSDAMSYFESYATARDKINEGLTLETVQYKSKDGSLKNKYRWVNSDGKKVSSEDKTKMIASAIRHDLEVK